MIDAKKFDKTLKYDHVIVDKATQKEIDKCIKNPVYFFNKHINNSNLKTPRLYKIMIDNILKGYKMRLFGCGRYHD
jgi:hypothetical protein